VLRCRTPEMIRKELWTSLLAYNLVRQVMLQAANRASLLPRQLSFSAAIQTIAASWLVMLATDDPIGSRLVDAALTNLAGHVVGNRPNPSSDLLT
jgi:hypothetical protein